MSKKKVQSGNKGLKDLTDKEKVNRVVAFSAEVEQIASEQIVEIMNKCRDDIRLAEAVIERITDVVRGVRYNEEIQKVWEMVKQKK